MLSDFDRTSSRVRRYERAQRQPGLGRQMSKDGNALDAQQGLSVNRASHKA